MADTVAVGGVGADLSKAFLRPDHAAQASTERQPVMRRRGNVLSRDVGTAALNLIQATVSPEAALGNDLDVKA